MLLSALAAQFDLELSGPDRDVSAVCTLADGAPNAIAFLANPQYASQLEDTQAAAVIVKARDAERCPVPALIAADPYLAYARIASVLVPNGGYAEAAPGVHADASVALTASLGDHPSIAAGARIGRNVTIGARAKIGANAVIEDDVVLGDDARIGANVTLCAGVRAGNHLTVHPGAVIGSRGFGLAPGPQGWEDVPQVGSVRIGHHVEIGANTAIDRGAIGDTELHDGVKLDNQIQIGHNCVIGAGTAIAGTVGIAGSTTIGKGCMIGGACMISGHLTICDGVIATGGTMIISDVTKPGMVSGGLPSTDNADWRKQIVRLRQLDKLSRTVKTLEKRLAELEPKSS